MSYYYIFFNYLISATDQSYKIADLIKRADPVVKLVLIILLVLSIVSWTIIFYKWWLFKKSMNESNNFMNIFRKGYNFDICHDSALKMQYSPIAKIFLSVYQEIPQIKNFMSNSPKSGQNFQNRGIEIDTFYIIEYINRITRTLKQKEDYEMSHLEKALPFLATIGSSAPFIGLFGTVWGIMNSFRSLVGATEMQSITAVAPGISEALIATAIGLVAAIPAVMAYNYFVSKLKFIGVEIERFFNEFLGIIEKNLYESKRN